MSSDWGAFQALWQRDPLAAPHAELMFETRGRLGQGGMGVVEAVFDRRLEREAALKLIRPEASTPRNEARFLREARITARLNHPAIPPVFEAGRTSRGQLYLLMRRIDGRSLSEELQLAGRRGPSERPLRELVEVVLKVAEAVAYAHSQGIVHRDLKPSNIMVGAHGEVLVMDWGLAFDVRDERPELDHGSTLPDEDLSELLARGLTLHETVVGTPGYMAPEQARGERVDERADIFALGALLTAALCGRGPIGGESSLVQVVATIEGRIQTPRQLDPRAPAELDAIAAAALAHDPAARTGSAEAVVADLRAWLSGAPVAAHRYSLRERAGRWARAHPAWLAAGLMGLTLASPLGLLAAQLQASEREQALTAASAARLEGAFEAQAEAERLADSGASALDVRQQLDALLDAGGRSPEVLLSAARIASRAGLREKAETLLTEAARDHPPAYDALLMLHRLESEDPRAGVTPALKELVTRARARGDDNAFVDLAQGNRAYREGLFEAAEAHLRKALERQPGLAEAAAELGATLRSLGRLDEALEQLDRALELNPSLLSARRSRLDVLSRLSRVELAERDAAWLRRVDGEGPYTRESLATYEMVRGRNDEAVALLRSVVAEDPENFAASHNLAYLLGRTGRGEESIAISERLQRREPSNVQVWTVHAEALLGLRRPAEALESVRKALNLERNDATALQLEALALTALGRKEEAVESFRRSLEVARKPEPSVTGLAELLKALGRPEEAMAVYEAWRERRPRSVGILNNGAILLQSLGRNEESLRWSQAAVDLDARDIRSRINLAGLLLKMERFEAAAREAEAVLALDPWRVEGLRVRAIALFKLARFPQAREAYTKLLAAAPDDAQSYAERGQCSEALGDLLACAVDYERAAALRPEHPLGWATLANLYQTLRLDERADAAYKRLFAIQPRLPLLEFNYGILCERLGRADEARRVMERLAQEGGEHAERARAWLKERR